jgi:hypothetical protein
MAAHDKVHVKASQRRKHLNHFGSTWHFTGGDFQGQRHHCTGTSALEFSLLLLEGAHHANNMPNTMKVQADCQLKLWHVLKWNLSPKANIATEKGIGSLSCLTRCSGIDI